ncbi:hypothetical protein [Pseudomonas sp. NFIX28]|uniref:hypothetical protein n=1 Tax=Pseudomonas sp. NFIX28 TaxID=1566235 RepID=UPI00089C81DA|nr:hypothetical protein [Pseudomonas sp. NFIX28]SDZ31700.1 hypothetical protein SAMN03159453_03214 [Pseudomonas sp. NFIX28]
MIPETPGNEEPDDSGVPQLNDPGNEDPGSLMDEALVPLIEDDEAEESEKPDS